MVTILTNIAYFVKLYPIQVILTTAVGYILGSISFSIIVTRQFKGNQDIRQMGSGNAGFTNVFRCVGAYPAVLTIVGDVCKGLCAALLGSILFSQLSFQDVPTRYITQYGAYLGGICCLIGHIWPCFFQFKGGKGVLTSIAMITIIDWRVGITLGLLFAVIFAAFRIISLASVICAGIYPLATFFVGFVFDHRHSPQSSMIYIISSTAIACIISSVVIYKHKSNIGRLLRGEEKKLTFAKNKV